VGLGEILHTLFAVYKDAKASFNLSYVPNRASYSFFLLPLSF